MVKDWNPERPWEPQPCDDDRSYAVFWAWVMKGGHANAHTAFLHVSKSFGVSYAQCEGWAASGYWRDRSAAYAASLRKTQQAVIQAEAEETAKEAANRALKGLRRIHKLAVREVEHLEQASARAGAGGFLTEKAILRVLLEGPKVERLIRGESTENVDTQIRLDPSKLTIEELEQLRALQQKAMPET